MNKFSPIKAALVVLLSLIIAAAGAAGPAASPYTKYSNLDLVFDTRRNLSPQNYARFHESSGILEVPLFMSPDEQGQLLPYAASLRVMEDKNGRSLFELMELRKAPQTVQGMYGYYDPANGIGYLPGVYAYSLDSFSSFNITLSLVPDSKPELFEVMASTPLPFFSGIQEVVQTGTDSVELSWAPALLPQDARMLRKAGNSLSYEVYLSTQAAFVPDEFSLYATVNGDTEFELSGLTPGVRYYALVIAMDGNGNRSLERAYAEITVDANHVANAQPEPQEQPAAKGKKEKVAPGQAKKIEHDEAAMELGADALESVTVLGIYTVDSAEKLPPIPPGMINVTKGPRKAYRFLPHGQKFKNKIKVRVPFDKKLLPEGYTEQDILTYYYDEKATRWIPLERAEIDSENGEVVSFTDHFTLMADFVTPCTLGAAFPDQYLCYGGWEQYSSPGNTYENDKSAYHHPVEGDAVVTHTLAMYQYAKPENSGEALYLGVDSSYAGRVTVLNTPTFEPVYLDYAQATIVYTAPMETGLHDIPLHIYNSSGIVVSTGLPEKTIYSAVDVTNIPDPEQPTDPGQPSDPEAPTDPEQPEDPEQPTEPEQPEDPEQPTVPELPPANHCNILLPQYLCYDYWEQYVVSGGTVTSPAEDSYVQVQAGEIVKHTFKLYNANEPAGASNHYLSIAPEFQGIVTQTTPVQGFSIDYHTSGYATISYIAPATDNLYTIPIDILNEAGEKVSSNRGLHSKIIVGTGDPCASAPPLLTGNMFIDAIALGTHFGHQILSSLGFEGEGEVEVTLNDDTDTAEMLDDGTYGSLSDGNRIGDNSLQYEVTGACSSATFPSTPAKIAAFDGEDLGPGCLTTAESMCPDQYLKGGADPVNTRSGNFTDSYVDATVSGVGEANLLLKRTYNSNGALWPAASIVRYTESEDGELEQEVIAGAPNYFGPGWTSSLGAYVLTIDKAPLFEGAQVLYPDGRTALFEKDGDSYTTDSPTNFDELEAEGDGYVLTIKKSLQKWHFNEDGNITEIEDRNGNTVTFNYADGALQSVENSAGRRMDITLDDDGHITQVALPENITLQYEYADGLLTAYTNGRGERTEYEYSGDKQLTKIVTPKGHPSLRMDYDGDYRVIEQIIGESAEYSFAYTDDTATVIDAYNNTYEHVYDDKGRLDRTVHPDGTEEAHDYNDDFMRTDYTDQAGNSWHYTFDDNGNRLSAAGPLGHYKEWQYNDQNRVISMREKVMGTTFREFTFSYDGNANLTQICMPLGDCAEITYDSRGLPTHLQDLNGFVTVNAYDNEGDLISVTNAENAVTQFDHDGLGRLASKIKPMDNAYTYTRDANNNLLAVDGPLGWHLGFEYDANDNLVRKIDPNGGDISIDYNASDKPVKITNQLNFDVATLSYGLMGELTGKQDAEGRNWAYDYNEVMRVVHIAAPEDTHFEFVYNPVGKIVDSIDANGTVKHVEYDDLYRPVTVIRNYIAAAQKNSDTNVTTQYTYDLLGNVLSMTDPEGFIFNYTYDLQGRKIAKQDAEQYAWEYNYDPMGNLLGVLDPNRHSTGIAYTPTNRVQSVTNPENHLVEFAYNPNGKLTDKIDAKGIVTHLEYNELDRLIRKIRNYQAGAAGDHETNVTTEYQHDPKGNLRFITNPRGYTAEIRYDAAHRRTEVVDYEDGLTRFFYDKVNNLIQVVDAEGNPTDFSFDDLDRLVSVTNAENETKRYHYDPMGNKTHLIEADGTVTLYEFDGVYRLNRVTQNYQDGVTPGNDVNVLTQYAYDARGLLTLITNANGADTAFEYDGVGNMVKETDPLQSVWQYVYDGVGNKTRRIDAKGDATEYAYYPDDLLKEIRYADDSAVNYRYDPNNNRVGMDDWLGNTAWTFDPLNRLTAQDDLFSRVLQVSYDAAGNRTGMVYPDGNQVAYEYSPNNWLSAARVPEDNRTDYTRNKVGKLTRIANPNSTVTDIVYDKVYRTLSQSNLQIGGAGKTNSAFEYQYNLVGHVTQVKNTYGWQQPNEQTETYTYDGLRRLASATIDPLKLNGDAVEMAYAYDPVGNRLSWHSNDNLSTQTPFDGFSKTYAYNAGNQMLEMVTDSEMPNGDYTALFSFDKNGNRINKLETDVNGPLYGTDYSYDYENRLTLIQDYQLVGSDDSNRIDRAYIANEYDGGGRRMSKRYDPKQGGNDPAKHKRLEYVWDGLDPVAEYNMLNGQRTDYYRGAQNRLLNMHQYKAGTKGTMYWYHYNFKGDVTGLSKHQGQSEHNYRYDPYGGVIADTGNFTEPHNHYTLTGKQFDEMEGKEFEEVTGLVYFGARYYEPTTGAWINQDSYRGTLDNPASLHRFGYVEGNPVTYWDWYGFEKVIILYGNYQGDNFTYSFEAAAETKRQMALKNGYSSNDILMKQVTTDQDVLDAIKGSDKDEIEELYIMAHGWDEYKGDWSGGLQLQVNVPGHNNWDESSFLTKEDITTDLSTYFADNSAFHIQGCEVGNSLFPQHIADTLGVDVYASTLPMKFWKKQKLESKSTRHYYTVPELTYYVDAYGIMYPYIEMNTYYYTTTEEYWVDARPGERVYNTSIRWVQYDGDNDSTRDEHIEMKPYDNHWYGDSINMDGYKRFTP